MNDWWIKERKKIEEFYKGTPFLKDALYIFNKCYTKFKKEQNDKRICK